MPQDVANPAATASDGAQSLGDRSLGHPSIFPGLAYRDAPAAIEWLCDAFGFEKVVVYEGEGGRIEHAELRLGNGMIMLGSPKGDAAASTSGDPTGPNAAGGMNDWSQSIYVVLPEVDKHHDRAKAAGARIVRELVSTDYGSRDYAARDLEGYVWNFGTYQPFAVAHDS